MPETVEIQIVKEQLEKLVEYSIEDIKLISGRYTKKKPDGYDKFIRDLTSNSNNPFKLKSVNKKGKFLWFTFGSSNGIVWHLYSTLGLTGHYYYCENIEDIDNELWNIDHIRVQLLFKKGSNIIVLNYSDVRNFGTFKFVNENTEPDALKKKLKTIAPDIFSKGHSYNWSFEKFQKAFEHYQNRRNNEDKVIVEVLNNQNGFISGVGNYIRADALYSAKINPFRKLKSITDTELSQLYESLMMVLKHAYKDNILGDPKKQKETGKVYGYPFKVYGQRYDLKGNKVSTKKDSKDRTVYYVPKIQK